MVLQEGGKLIMEELIAGSPMPTNTGTKHAHRPAPPRTYSSKQLSYVYASAVASSPRARRSAHS